MTIPFGKYRGERLDLVPLNYLDFILNKCEIEENLRDEIEKQFDEREFTLPFGKFKDWELSEVRSDYLMWFAGMDNISERLKEAIEIELEERDFYK